MILPDIKVLKCRHAEAYLGMREPRCGCAACWIKYLARRVEYLVAIELNCSKRVR